MDYKIALPPELGLSPEELVAAWNEDPECRAVAQARLDESSGTQYDPTFLAGVAVVLGNVALGIATNALYDLIKQTLIKKGVIKSTEITPVPQQSGTIILVVMPTEDLRHSQ